ncbi:hypothetical protein [Mucilaginibacter sp. KACC 22063]|uniref:hypothetical protein n=1 Tax=Mucilaginibacter sp. KACC 22063 TaxID=3025666 RepID=UPI0023667155|nr:hypothetical protein [Mucilaginibacter sp. KACC 22063]WDF57135.1 hypothetical protein PQ461_08720 [Mucilaginibacter sp. KACC 22063]
MAVNSDIKKFLIRASLLLLIVFVIDRATGALFAHLNKRQIAGKYSPSNKAFNGVSENVVIFGPSTARNHYDVPLLSQELNTSVRSVAEPAMCPVFHDVQLHFIVRHHLPKLVIMDVRSQELIGQGFERPAMVSLLLPYYNAGAKDAFKVLNQSEDFRSAVLKAQLSHIYRYNSQLLYLLQSNYKPSANDKQVLINKGFEPLTVTPDAKLQKLAYRDYGFDTAKPDSEVYNAINDFISTATKNKIKVMLVVPPKFYRTNDQIILSSFKKNIREKYGDILYDFSTDTTFTQHPEYFANRLHLNADGAKIFTAKIASIAKPILASTKQ